MFIYSFLKTSDWLVKYIRLQELHAVKKITLSQISHLKQTKGSPVLQTYSIQYKESYRIVPSITSCMRNPFTWSSHIDIFTTTLLQKESHCIRAKGQRRGPHVVPSDSISWATEAHGSCRLPTHKPPPHSG